MMAVLRVDLGGEGSWSVQVVLERLGEAIC
jgi:hypothetical protein